MKIHASQYFKRKQKTQNCHSQPVMPPTVLSFLSLIKWLKNRTVEGVLTSKTRAVLINTGGLKYSDR